MKRVFSALFCLAILLGILNIGVSAAESPIASELYPENEIMISQEIQTFSDGSSLVITVSQLPNQSKGTTSTVSGSKTYSGRNSDGDVMWQFILHGTFSVNTGVSATCTAASHDYNILDSSWNYDSGSSSRSGNQAFGHGVFKKKFLFITVETRECDVTLTCSVNGVLS